MKRRVRRKIARGEPFVGQAGRLLDNMLRSLGMTREGQTPEAVYIANVLKCRPPGNRNPQPDEVARCEPFLMRQIELIEPDADHRDGPLRGAVVCSGPTLASQACAAGRIGSPSRVARSRSSSPTTPPICCAISLDKAKSWADLCLARTSCANRALSCRPS